MIKFLFLPECTNGDTWQVFTYQVKILMSFASAMPFMACRCYHRLAPHNLCICIGGAPEGWSSSPLKTGYESSSCSSWREKRLQGVLIAAFQYLKGLQKSWGKLNRFKRKKSRSKEEILYCEGGKAQEQVDQKNCGRLVTGRVQCQVG